MKKIAWIGSSRKDLKACPDEICDAIGRALFLVQKGTRPHGAKTLTGLEGVTEIRKNDESGTYRAVYTAELGDLVFVLHVFQKKSKSGITTPKQDIDLIRQRLKEAKSFYEEHKRGGQKI